MNSWVTAWQYGLGLPPELPAALVALCALVFVFLFLILPCGGFVFFLERKFSADIQARVGPNRSGPAGVFQPLADGLKLLQKRVHGQCGLLDGLSMALYSMALFASIAVLPLGSTLIMVDTDMSVFMPFWSILALSVGTSLLGLGSGAVPGWFGGVRIAAITIASAFPALVALLIGGLAAGGFKWTMLAGAQSFSPFTWSAFSTPFGFVAFTVFVVSGMMLLGIAPLEGGFSFSELRGGVASHLWGLRLALFRFARFYGFFLWSSVAAVVFLGAWNIPAGLVETIKENEAWRVLQVAETAMLIAKTLFLMLAVCLIGRVTPRVRSDQVTDLALKVLSPFAIAALAGAAIWISRGGLA